MISTFFDNLSFSESLTIILSPVTGVKGIADLYTNFLRNMGYDVIDYGNAKHFEYSKTKVLVHNKNHKDFIYEVVELLEINPEHLEYNYDKNIHLCQNTMIE